MNTFDITANKIRQVKDGAVNDIEDHYASKSDIQRVLDSKADQANTYTKQQIDANFYDITETYDKTEINVLSNSTSSNTFLIGNLTITSKTNFNNISSNTNLMNNLNSTTTSNFNNIPSNIHLINNLSSTITSTFNNVSSNSNLISTNFNNISSSIHLINNLSSTITSNFNNISSNSNLIAGLNSTINSHIIAISDLQNGGSFNETDYYNTITNNILLSES